jgi:hypothetical protein
VQGSAEEVYGSVWKRIEAYGSEWNCNGSMDAWKMYLVSRNIFFVDVRTSWRQ